MNRSYIIMLTISLLSSFPACAMMADKAQDIGKSVYPDINPESLYRRSATEGDRAGILYRSPEAFIRVDDEIIPFLTILADTRQTASHAKALERIKEIYGKQITTLQGCVAANANADKGSKRALLNAAKAKACLKLAQMLMQIKSFDECQIGLMKLSKEFSNDEIAFEMPAILVQ